MRLGDNHTQSWNGPASGETIAEARDQRWDKVVAVSTARECESVRESERVVRPVRRARLR